MVRQWIAGVDEAGRGPLAGPVVAAAVIYQTAAIPALVNDSKALSEKKRLQLFPEIKASADAWAIGIATVAEIDSLNIHHATLKAMQRAIEGLAIQPGHCLVDGKFIPHCNISCQAIIGGDAIEPLISAASILAKVTRDQYMLELDQAFPQYQFAQHKGYGTKAHLSALAKHGPCEHHRRSFKPVKELLI